MKASVHYVWGKSLGTVYSSFLPWCPLFLCVLYVKASCCIVVSCLLCIVVSCLMCIFVVVLCLLLIVVLFLFL